MATQLHNELKKEFQLERLILFSDAVFAIAITLLVIEIKIPAIHGQVTNQKLLNELGLLIPKFIGFLISFMLIGLYWTVHHRMFGFVTSYSKKLIILNLVFLFFIALMPFSTGFYSEYARPSLLKSGVTVPLTFYVLNFASAGFMIFFLWLYISNPKNKIAEPAIDRVIAAKAIARSITVPIIFLIMLPVAYYINVVVAIYIPMLIPIVIRILNRVIDSRYATVKRIKRNNNG